MNCRMYTKPLYKAEKWGYIKRSGIPMQAGQMPRGEYPEPFTAWTHQPHT